MMTRRFRIVLSLFVLCTFSSTILRAQDLLDGVVDNKPVKEYQKNAFKSTRVINGQSIEFLGHGVLDFRILHRFGKVNSGSYGAWGLDGPASIRLGLDYGITDRLMIGIGRGTVRKEVDAFAKYRLIWQSKGARNSWPFSVVLVSGITQDGRNWKDMGVADGRTNYYSSKLAFFHQVIIGRKFTEGFSFQVSPTVIHRNLVDSVKDKNDIYSLGIATRLKFTKRMALTVEYFYTPDAYLPTGYQNPLSIGLDIETGGHVFQLHFTNALGMNERSLIAGTDGQWGKGDIHFGFNISRVFTIANRKTFKKKG
jgi:hypothetical protein